MTLGQIIALGAMAAARHISEAEGKLDSDGTPLWPAEPTEEDWAEFDRSHPHSHDYKPGIDEDCAYQESYERVARAAADTVGAWS